MTAYRASPTPERPTHLLARLRTGIPIRRVRCLGKRADVRGDVPTLFVVFADGSTSTLGSTGDLAHLLRIEQLLLVQMELGSSRGQVENRVDLRGG
jgi:hypothetical protein